MTVRITFQAPRRTDSAEPPIIHERILEGVPEAVAEQIRRDLESFRSRSRPDNPWKLYRYDSGDGEIVVPLDFREVVALETEH